MAAIIQRAREEPALLVSLALVLINLIFGDEHAENAWRVIESVALLVGGIVIRQNVTPTSKLPESRRG